MCHDDDGRIPIQEWLNGLDVTTCARVRIQIDRMEDGGFGDVEPIGGGASEKKLHFWPGYRIYFGVKGKVIHLLCGRSKATQQADIKFAKGLWDTHG